jgi:hypothetical protein
MTASIAARRAKPLTSAVGVGSRKKGLCEESVKGGLVVKTAIYCGTKPLVLMMLLHALV